MANALPETSAGHVVRFVEALDKAPTPPAELPIPRRINRAGQVIAGILLVAAIVAAVLIIIMLWAEPSPGWWLSAFFTAFIGMVVLGVSGIYLGWVIRISDERKARSAWRDRVSAVRAEPATVADREVRLGEDGDVLAFSVVVTTTDGSTVGGQWRPSGDARNLLQPQVPGVGSAARVWQGPGEGPVLVDVLDPTVVRAGAAD